MGFIVDAVKSVGKAVVGVVKGVVNVVKDVVKAAVNVVSSVINFIAQPFMGLLGGVPEVPAAQEAERQQGVLVQQNGGGAVPIPVVYGDRKVGGIVTYAETGATNNKYLWVVYTFSEGPCVGVRELYLNDEALPSTVVADLNGGKTVSIAEGKFKNRVTMRWSPGVYFSNPASSTLGTELKGNLFKDAPSFTSTMVHNGLACLFVRYEWLAITTQAEADANPFSGEIPRMQVYLKGRTVASLETSTSESYAYGAAGYSERWSSNPAEILLDYLRNPRYGKGLTNTDIDWDSWRIAAAKCNTTVTYTSTNIQGPIMTCNYVLDTSYTIFQNVKILLQGFRAYMPFVQGKFKLKIEDAGHPTDILSGVATIIANATSSYQIRDESLLENQYDIMGDVVYTGIERSAKYSSVIVTYVDPDQKWSNQQVVYPVTEAEQQTYIAIDGGRENKLEATFPTITNSAMAWDMARLLFNKSRYQETCRVRLSSQSFELEPGDNIRIQSQILNFGTTPWRVINIAYNDDYTFDVSCVRNPDSLYPYSRVGEPDVVLPIYVPKGATIYYPVEKDLLPIGLVPPTTVPFNPNPPTAPTNPTPVPPSTPPTDGGGVGGSGGIINITDPNKTPPPAPVPAPLDDILDVTNIQYVTKNGLVYARLTAKQPSHAMFAGVNIYYALNSSTGYTLLEDRQRPGAGGSYTIDVGPLAVVASIQASANQYKAYIRVTYTTSELSTKFTLLTLNPANSEAAGTNPSEVAQIASSSWPTLSLAPAGARDTRVDICRVLVSQPQSNPRTATIELSQDVRTQNINFDVTGVNIYAKSDASTYWTKTSYVFSNYSPGSLTSFAYTGYLGALGTGISGSTIVTGGGAIYTFVFRLTFVDGTESSQQYVATGKVQNPGYATGTGINIFYGIGQGTDSAVTKTGYMGVNDLAITLEPPGAATAALDIQLSVDTTFTTSTTGINFVMFAPTAQVDKWQGIRVRYRPVVPGTNPAFTTQDFTSATDISTFTSGTTIYTGTYNLSAAKKDTYYEMVITPLVRTTANYQEAKISSYGMGYVSQNTTDQNYPKIFTASGAANWSPLWRWTQMDTGIATNTLNRTFDSANPVASVRSCIAYVTPPTQGKNSQNQSTTQIREYISLTYDCSNIPTFSKLYVYRRHFFATPSGSSTEAKYFGIGRWERITATASSGTLNLRLPTGYDEFDRNFGTTNSVMYGVPDLTRGYSRLLTGLDGKPYGTASDNSVNGDSKYLIPLTNYNDFAKIQLLLIVETASGVSTQGLLIKGQQLFSGTSSVDFLTSSTGVAIKPVTVEYQSATDANAQWIRDSDFPLVNSRNYRRKLSDARTTLASVADMIYNDNAGSGLAYQKTTASGAIYDTILLSTLPGTGTV